MPLPFRKLFRPREKPIKKVSFVCERGHTSGNHADILRAYLEKENLGDKVKVVSSGVHKLGRKTANADLVVSLYYSPEYLETDYCKHRRKQINKNNPRAIKMHVPMREGYWDYEAMVREIIEKLGLKK